MDDLITRLKEGCIYLPKRWSGDTHSDVGTFIDEEATNALMQEAALKLESLLKEKQDV